ncbi:hypothetical protein ABGB18_45395 [Nonomuraea sp. B12E4]|uniref:hypothetical protein n=1 Tax=Nonomuraea sp. B12E4 TaxID=3153564 RepID=UPI00325ED0EE
MDLKDIFFPSDRSVRPARFVGEYFFAHDGWPGVLRLQVSAGRNLRGEYRDHRLDQTFTATGQIDLEVRHRITLVIHDFNWLPEQRFTGYLFTHGDGRTIAGTTTWETEPFGFVAFGDGALPPAVPGQVTNQVTPTDFTGSYTMLHDGHVAEINLEHAEGRLLTGVYRHPDLDDELAVEGEIDADFGHGCAFRFTGDARLSDVRLHGYLFTRPKNAISGEIVSGGTPTGFVMLRRS